MQNFTKSVHFLPILALSIVVLFVYLRTMPPGLTWEHYGYDAGDLISCVYTWGIPHPPGTPLYVLVGQIFKVLPFFSVPAAKFNFMSVFFGLLSLITAYFASFKVSRNRFASLAAAALLAFTPLLWSQSIIAEVLTLNLFLVGLSTCLLISWERSDTSGVRQDSLLYGALFSFGLALTNHTSSIMFAPAVLFMILSTASKILKRPKSFLKVGFFFLMGLLPYLYLPIRSLMQPSLNWGDPSSFSRFISHVTAREYQEFLFVAPVLFLDNLARFSNWIWGNFNPLGSLLLVLGFFFGRRDRVRDFLIFSTLFQLLFALNYNIVNIETYLLPVFFNLALFSAEGYVVAKDLFSRVTKRLAEKDLRLLARIRLPWDTEGWEVTFTDAALFLFNLLLVGVAGVNVFLRWDDVNLRSERKAFNYGRGVFEVLDPGAIVLTEGDEFFLGLTYFKHAVFPERTDVAVFHEAFFYKLGWMLKQAKRTHPELEFPESGTTLDRGEAFDRLLEFVEMNWQEHPIFLAIGDEPLGTEQAIRTTWADRYIIQSVGPIYKIIGKKEGDHEYE